MDNRPIGVFDSGLGGLTAVRELRRVLPGENIVYLGDTGRVPYGTRGRETIRRYARQDFAFLQRHDIKMIVIACGTVSTAVTQEDLAALPVPCTGVVPHTAAAACQATRNGRIGVIATPATIRSGAFQREIARLAPEATVVAKACPLFVPLAENGCVAVGDPVATPAARMYLEELCQAGVDTLVLGCTHYPILSGVIDQVLEHRVTLIDSGRETALYLRRYLAEHGLLADRAVGECEYYVTDSTESFSTVGSLFLQDDIQGRVTQVDLEAL